MDSRLSCQRSRCLQNDGEPSTVPLEGYVPDLHNVNVDDQLTSVDGNQATVSCHKETGSKIFKRQLENMSDGRFCNGTAVSAGEWADSLTNISVGDLLSEVPHDMDALSVSGSSQCYQQMPFSCDSFDAAIAAHIYRHQDKMETASTLAAHASSIWDAEETCDAFSFQKNPVPHEVSRSSDVASLSACKFARTNSMGSGGLVEELPDAEGPTDTDYTGCEDPMDECLFDPHNLDNSVKDFSALTDLYWPESLAPLDMDIPSAKYCSEDLVLSDSLGGLNRLIASSLDAFQNCSFFGLDKKEQAPTVEAGETASISGFKIGSQC